MNMRINHLSKMSFLAAAISPSLIFVAGSVHAAAFQNWELTAIGAGVAHADMAAGAYDPSTAYYNPAGMTRFDHPEVSAGNIWVAEVTDISDLQLTNNLGFTEFFPASGPLADTTSNFDAAAPNFYLVYPFDNIPFEPTVGLAINGPYGAGTYYHDTELTTYAKKTTEKAILINPSVAFNITEKLSFGAGLDIQELKSVYTADPNINVFINFNHVHIKQKDWSTGWNLGLLYEFTEATRVGATYRSKISYDQDGSFYIDLSAPGSGSFNLGLEATNHIELPATTTFGIYHDISNRWSVMASGAYVQWDSLKDISIDVLGADALFDGIIVQSPIVTNLNLENTWFFAVGTAYELTKKWTLRTGFNYDQTPTNDENREARLPDSDRYAFAAGAGYKITPRLQIDVAYQFIYTPSVDFSNVYVAGNPLAGTEIDINEITYDGKAKSHANLWGVQLTYDFCCKKI